MEADSTRNLEHLDWVNKLEELASQNGKDGGRRGYICVKEDTIEVYRSKREAKSAGFKPITFKVITNLTHEKLEGCLDAATLDRAAQAMHRIAKMKEGKTKVSRKMKGVFSNVFPTQASKMEKYANRLEESARKLKENRSELAKSHELEKEAHEMEKSEGALFSDSFEETLNHATGATRSAGGHRGVIFVETDREERIVLKTSYEPLPELGAERLFDLMGFTTPCSRPVEIKSREGDRISEVLLKHAANIQKSGDYRKSVNTEITLSTYFFVMDCLDATSFDDLLPNQKMKILEDGPLLQMIGEIVLYDHFSGNNDRLNDVECNAGNFMLGAGEQGSRLVIIDSTIDTDRPEEELEDLLKEGSEKKIAKALIDDLTEYRGIDEERELFVRENIAKGIRAGAEKLLAQLPENELLSAMTEIPSIPPSEQVDYDVLAQRLEKIRAFVKKD